MKATTTRYWLTTDTHLGHKQMIEYCGRPEGFEQIILDNLKKVLLPSDVLIHLGDVCIGSDEKWNKELLSLPGKKWLIKGNHDNKSNSWYLRQGWDFVGNTISDIFFGKKIVLSHAPVKVEEDIDLMIHGHFHNTLHRLLEKQWVSPDEEKRNEKDLGNLTPKHKLLAIEYTNLEPVLLKNFIGV